MDAYELLITPAAAKELDAIPQKKERQAVVERIRHLAAEPRPSSAVKLSARDELYRVRQGRYRIVYTVDDRRLLVTVMRIADRKDVYRKKSRPARSPHRARGFDPRR